MKITTILVFGALLIFPSLSWSQTNTVEITSFIPSPIARYDRLYLEPRAALSGSCEIGTIYLKSPSTFQVCEDNGFGTGQYTDVTTSTTAAMAASGNYVYPTATASNSNLRVGVGTSVPSTKLHVYGNTSAATALATFQNSVGDMQLFVSSGTPESSITGNKGDMAVDITNGVLYVKTTTGGTTGWSSPGSSTAAYASVRRDTDTGSSSIPYPEFDVFESGTFTSLVTASNVTFTSANGRFTVAVAGTYQIDATVIGSKNSVGSDEVNFRIYRNGTEVYEARYAIVTGSTIIPISANIILSLSASDYIEATFDGVGASARQGSVLTIRKID